MGKKFEIVNGDISDGYHTFDELYDHRCLLFLLLCLRDTANCTWKKDYPDWFCLYWESPAGQISYHLPNRFLKLVQDRIPQDQDYKWDGHARCDVIHRLMNLAWEGAK